MMKRNLLTIPVLSLVFGLFLSCSEDKPDNTPTALSAPSGVVLHGSGESSFTFQWSPVTGATSYEWQLLDASNAVFQKGSVTSRNVTVSPVEAGVKYSFKVRAVSAESTSDWSSPIEAYIEKKPEPGPDPSVDYTKYYGDFMIPSVEEDGSPRAFPGAEGGGMYATGGRGGKVLHVTTLEDTGSEGSLRWACTQNYPRIIVFDVAGVIALKSQLQVNKPDCTIAGQTAPGDGICLKNYTFRISASNVIVRFIRCRMGDETKTEDDAMQVMDHTDDKYSNIIIDHCSISWSTDECASFYGMKDFTFSWNIVSESLRNSVHGKGSHGYGGIWGGNNATYHHNLLAHHDSRNPRIDHDYVSTQKGPVTIANNVVYNWRGNTCYGGESANSTGEFRKYNFVGNYYKPGPVTPSNKRWLIDPTTSCSYCTSAMGVSTIVPGHFYMAGNIMDGSSSVNTDNWTGTTASASLIPTIRSESPFADGTFMTLHSAADAFTKVLEGAGASFARDRIDARIASETREGKYTYKGSNGSTNGLIDTQTDVAEDWWKNGFPVYGATPSQIEAVKDTDGDGMSNEFEDKFSLDKFDASDAQRIDLDKNGRYTNLEMYLHYLVREMISASNAGGTYTNMK